uniref:ATP synthase F0 subunit 6 n=1 Tax=Phthiridium szechuanum TaxID=2982585 RepID=UPI0022370A96|nr:ATP synthase F0 subunit 6 [Phthiridium szechuanum]UYP50979.1 ATP synthase F0 subunit 6 [Phthiridium szechuanum]
MNLFSSFDPSSNIFMIQFNWLSIFIGLMLIPSNFWIFPSRYSLIWLNMINFLHKEIKILLNKKLFKGSSLLLISIFSIILFNNFMSLFPYIFSCSSHMIFSISLSLPIWTSLMIFSWFNNYNHMFAHLIPENTPFILLPLMVCIETISNIIRPLTLAIRLSANLIAGHLLLTLLGNISMLINFPLLLILIFIQLILMFLELAVSIIQSYVFMILLTLYSSEII